MEEGKKHDEHEIKIFIIIQFRDLDSTVFFLLIYILYIYKYAFDTYRTVVGSIT